MFGLNKYIAIISAILALTTGAAVKWALNERDSRIEIESSARARNKADSIEFASLRALYDGAQKKLASTSSNVGKAIASYDTIRKEFVVFDTITSTIRILKPEIFVSEADNLRKQCNGLLQDCAQFRVDANRLTTNLLNQLANKNIEIASRKSKEGCSLIEKSMYFVIGAAGGAAASNNINGYKIPVFR